MMKKVSLLALLLAAFSFTASADDVKEQPAEGDKVVTEGEKPAEEVKDAKKDEKKAKEEKIEEAVTTEDKKDKKEEEKKDEKKD